MDLVTALNDGSLVEVRFSKSPAGRRFAAHHGSHTAMGEGPTPRKAYYALMQDCQDWPQAARDALYVMLYPNIPQQPGEKDNSLGPYQKVSSQPGL